MSIEQMTGVSYFFFFLAGMFAVLAAALFFALDIARCWKMVAGRHTKRVGAIPLKRNNRTGAAEKPCAEGTMFLEASRTMQLCTEETVLLENIQPCTEETVLLEDMP